ncbi:MAG TPA: pitrilysin family protein [Pyrinomonadaceae bacterium]|jgi:predicted Zn-dependent peptidase|nr:pitrilysin family protein [Pyrinomonadaceae bacterium]
MNSRAKAQRRKESRAFAIKSSSLRLCAFAGVLVCASLAAHPIIAQPASQPEREQLLNGLRLMFWLRPGTPDVTLKLRINSGAAFDLAGKAGQMSLLGDILFPDPATVDFFTDEMGGKLEVSVGYDSTTITMVGKAAEFEQIIEVLRNALLSTPLTPEVVTRMRDQRIKLLRDTSIAPATVADRAITARLYGDFPYGRPAAGTAEEVSRVDRADLMQARDRFLNSNNATLAIIGGVTKQRAMKAVRQLLGPWRKSEQIVPTTFRQPTPADTRTLIVNVPGPTVELRLAARGVARSDSDFAAATVLARLAQNRWQAAAPELAKQPVFARNDAFVLPGAFVMGAAVNEMTVADSLAKARKVIDSLMSTSATPEELERAKNEVINELTPAITRPEALADPWLDADTYRFSAPQDQIALLRAVTATEVQRVANRLFNKTIVSVVTGESASLKAALQGRYQYEVLGEIATPAPSPKPPAKPSSNDNPR